MVECSFTDQVVVSLMPDVVTKILGIVSVSRKDFLDIQEVAESRFTVTDSSMSVEGNWPKLRTNVDV